MKVSKFSHQVDCENFFLACFTDEVSYANVNMCQGTSISQDMNCAEGQIEVDSITVYTAPIDVAQNCTDPYVDLYRKGNCIRTIHSK